MMKRFFALLCALALMLCLLPATAFAAGEGNMDSGGRRHGPGYFHQLMEAVSETQYINDHDYVEKLLSDLVSSFSKCRDSYVMESDSPPVPFDRFIRTAVPGVPYYIGAVMEYHC